jgi:hypothetical protein
MIGYDDADNGAELRMAQRRIQHFTGYFTIHFTNEGISRFQTLKKMVSLEILFCQMNTHITLLEVARRRTQDSLEEHWEDQYQIDRSPESILIYHQRRTEYCRDVQSRKKVNVLWIMDLPS